MKYIFLLCVICFCVSINSILYILITIVPEGIEIIASFALGSLAIMTTIGGIGICGCIMEWWEL